MSLSAATVLPPTVMFASLATAMSLYIVPTKTLLVIVTF